MKKSKYVNSYLKYAVATGILGWVTLGIAGFLAVLGYYTYSLLMGAVSIFVGWILFGYFTVRYGLSQGKNVKQIISERFKWYKTKRH